ncbi:hypothetical protein H310_02714 [Aphanomyces invadans]|uniref:CBM1 domain-containing protein n=1 Tax=Aphanomyces invadans TaxID=157072 RepID=A0A024ULJ1_9STRA|nr:hypothetical protein H310_02714 [Aphanomyces invadans]ETW06458.1 hypothetical protein H310_02714 [Aphanomyces invadans]|eukprot:XP_008864533.1 hypothetical protein H310_02714 [Aphanomyces invadans]
MQVPLIVSALVAAAAADLACVAEYGLCDTGAPCCNANSTCHRFDDNVAQCLPASHQVKNTHERAASGEAKRVCATTWSQCDGQNWPNGVCCISPNDRCVKHNDYYSQCIPMSSTTSVPTQANARCSENWSQCNGQNWPNGVCCKDPLFQCNFKNQYLSLCEPKRAAKAAEASCTNVSVVGDATYCVKGAICGDEGDVCPKKGDTAVGDCISTLMSYVGATSSCVAPADATCQKIPITTTGAPVPTTANSGKCSTNWSQCNGQNWPYGVCCEDASFQCNYKNQYLSLCEPKQPAKAAEASGVVAVWQQCGGKAYQGPKQCTTGNTCEVINEWYSQCRPAPTKDGVLATWARCGGIGHTGLTKCRDEDKCVKHNDYYSQCVPK